MNGTVLKSMTLVGKRSFLGTHGANKDKPYYVLDVLVSLSEQEKVNGFFGFEIKQKYLSKELWEKVKEEDLGKKIDFDYKGDEYGNSYISNYDLSEYLLLVEE